MNILFVSSGNASTSDGITAIVKNQATALQSSHRHVTFFKVNGKGLKSYMRAILQLRKVLLNTKPDVVHAHYSLCGFVAALSGSKPLVVSLMGSDVKSEGASKYFIFLFAKHFWNKTIVKSEDMKKEINLSKVHVIPNGVDLSKFYPQNKIECKQQLGWNSQKKHVLFAANPNRREKNFSIAQAAFNLLDRDNIELEVLENVPNSLMPVYHNAADVVLLTSLWEGSPNVIKEAMACNRPTVASSVGDIEWLFGKTQGLFLSGFNIEEIANKIEQALTIAESKGRGRIEALKLDDTSTVKKLTQIYTDVLRK